MLAAQSELKSRERFAFLLSTDRLSPRLKIADLLYQPLLESQGFLTLVCDPGSWSVVLTELGSWTSPNSFEMFVFKAVRRGLESFLGPSGG